ncbi:hypothetical protein EHP00_2676 [Ecytonucleospora hepatopenaei]|nr:hypothetical protein EHP00_2676 [Ecytonucleospora hepatopenaei]
MREGEKHGIDYFFVSKKEFEEKIKEGFFVEYTFFNENYYGTPKNQGDPRHIVIYDCDKKGIECFSSKLKNIKFVYVHAGEDEILDRLKQRKNITEEEINARKKTMKESMEFAKNFKFDFIVETSKSINLTLNEVDFIISTYFL